MKILASTKLRNSILGPVLLSTATALSALTPAPIQAQQLPEVNILTAVGNMAFSAVWVAEQLKYFEQEGVRAKITPAGGGAPCPNALVCRSAPFFALSSEGLVLGQIKSAPLIAIQAHNRNLTL